MEAKNHAGILSSTWRLPEHGTKSGQKDAPIHLLLNCCLSRAREKENKVLAGLDVVAVPHQKKWHKAQGDGDMQRCCCCLHAHEQELATLARERLGSRGNGAGRGVRRGAHARAVA
jgi:hypothetical protein